MINIVGAGLAGLSAAISLAERNIRCNLISVQESQRAQSVMAEGGINAALNTMGEDDDVSLHFEDTLKGGAYLGEKSAIKGLTEHAPEIVKWLKSIGVPFESKDGKIVLRNFGGQKKKRTAYVKSSTGKMLTGALIDEARKYEVKGLIRRFDHHEVTDLLIEDGRCLGLKMADLYSNKAYEAKGPVIMATGGLTGMFPGITTGSRDNTGLLLSRLFLKGLKLSNLEMIQYHPTTINIGAKRLLVSEAARGEGGRFLTYRNGEPYYFMEDLYPEQKNLVTRDVASRTIYKIQHDENCQGIYLDMTGIDKEVFKGKLSDMRAELLDYIGVDIAEKPFAIEPGIHYFMGGIRVDDLHRSNIENLYAAGECACKYHGANRLGGNSLLGAIYGGKVAAANIAEDQADEIKEIENDRLKNDEVYAEKLKGILLPALGIVREKNSIEHALYEIETLLHEDLNEAQYAKTMLAKAILMSALQRKESRGAHYRADYPETDEKFRRSSVASFKDDVVIEYADVDGGSDQ